MSEKIDISIVIPVYNSAQIFPVLYKRMVKVLTEVANSFEIIAVVDGCDDNSAEVVAKHCEGGGGLKMVEFSRNFGHQAAITAGLQFASGEMVIVMDDDLEDPPELFPDFIAKANEGYEVVYGIRKKRKTSFIRRMCFYGYYRLLGKLTDINIPYDAGDFCLMRRTVVDALNAMPEKNLYIRGIRTWLGFRQVGIEYERGTRLLGGSGYSLAGYFKLGLDGILSFSYKPLRYVSAMGFIIAAISFIFGISAIILKLMGKISEVPGWTSIVVSVSFLGGVHLISIGILGQYIARIYDEVKQRHRFVVKRLIGLGEED